MRLLVTGAAGFIGANFVRYWTSHHPADHVVALDALTYAGNRSSLEPEIPFAHLDIGDLAAVTDLLASHRLDVIVNFAAESHNSLAVLDPRRFFQTNVLGTQNLLEAARQAGIGRFHHVSTCEVYGDLALDDPGAFTEESPYRPRTPYNASKAGADHAVRAYHETFGLPITITNCANNYGPYQLGLTHSLLETVPDRPGHDRRYLLDSTKLRTSLGWSPVVGFDEGLFQTLSWYQENRTWWQPLLERTLVSESRWAENPASAT